jgi:hypothetical protein
MRTEATGFTGAVALEIPGVSGGPQHDLRLLLRDAGAEREILRINPFPAEFAHLRSQTPAGFQALVVEALFPELVVEESVDVRVAFQRAAEHAAAPRGVEGK